MNEEIERFLNEHLWSEETREKYGRAALLLISEVADLAGLDASGLRAWLKRHAWGSAAEWVAFSASKAFLRWKFGDQHPALRLKIKRAASPPGRSLKMAQVRQLLESFDTSGAKGRRDLAICTLALDSALRSSELCALELAYLDLEAQSLRVVIKGGEWGEGVYSVYTASCLATWLADRAQIVREKERAVFVGVGGNTPGLRMTRCGLGVEVRRWGLRIGIKLSPHDLRRTFGNQVTRAGAPQRVAMLAGRWKSEKAFERYTLDLEPGDIVQYSPVMRAMEDGA